ncbi:hypothetical protein EDF67_11115 [Sphingobacterium sp. JUb78]|nr:hypothetical protein [Sphingobacterium kitahiroshimense]TCR03797.1 hypothetical protein EDF67_11115 [Sphingobacterium sp. JUb78]
MARSAVDRLTTAFLELSPTGLPAAIVNVDSAINAAAANVFAKVFHLVNLLFKGDKAIMSINSTTNYQYTHDGS